jgi:DNA topoisomerase-1
LAAGVTLPYADPAESAAAAGLRYVSDEMPGLRREARGDGFVYRDQAGALIHDAQTLERIKALVIPPAWTDVWICPNPRGHVQVTGRDARGRKQYRYHERWTAVRDEAKYEHLVSFAAALPRIRAAVDRDLRRHGMPKRKVLATVVKLLEETSIRIGNDEYARDNHSFGLTTMRDRHAHFAGSTVRFEFKGKSGKVHKVSLSDRRLARIVKQCHDLPGQELFQYVDEDGQRHAIESDDVNAYLKEISRGEFTAKDFRTWNGTVLAARFLKLCERPTSATAGKRLVSGAIKNVARELGNTPAVCRRAYVHPVVLNAYLDGALGPEGVLAEPRPARSLTGEEKCVVKLLKAS